MKLKQIDEKIERAKKQIAELRVSRHEALLAENRRRKKAAQFRLGDIVKYGSGIEHKYDDKGNWTTDASKERPLLITQITYKGDGTPRYGGLQIINGKLTRVWGNTDSWMASGKATLVGDASQLRFCQNGKLTNPAAE